MSTFMANKANIERKWYVVDAAGKPLGKTAVIVNSDFIYSNNISCFLSFSLKFSR